MAEHECRLQPRVQLAWESSTVFSITTVLDQLVGSRRSRLPSPDTARFALAQPGLTAGELNNIASLETGSV